MANSLCGFKVRHYISVVSRIVRRKKILTRASYILIYLVYVKRVASLWLQQEFTKTQAPWAQLCTLKWVVINLNKVKIQQCFQIFCKCIQQSTTNDYRWQIPGCFFKVRTIANYSKWNNKHYSVDKFNFRDMEVTLEFWWKWVLRNDCGVHS